MRDRGHTSVTPIRALLRSADTGRFCPFALLVGSLACADPAPLNIFLIVVDTLRADHLGTYGYERDTSPHIDPFAADALVFERSLARAPETRFSMASLLTGFLPHETGSLDATSYNTSISCRRSAPCSVSHLIRACADAI